MTLWTEHRFDSRDAAEAACAAWLAARLHDALAATHGAVGLLLSGGSTPDRLLGSLLSEDLDWDRIDIAASDERLVPVEHPASTEGMIRRHFDAAGRALRYAAPGPHDDPDAALAGWRTALAGMRAWPSIGLIGIGGDAHTASLFPGQAAALDDALDTAFVAETPPHVQPRLTLGLAALQRVGNLALVAADRDKRAALDRIAATPEAFALGKLAARAKLAAFTA